MSTLTKLGFTTVLFIASIGIGAAQDASLDVAAYPAITNPLGAPPSARVPLGQESAVVAGPSGLSENAYDFTNPDSIPGFGTLPPDYDSSGVMPRIGSQ
jgi:hypothetical protein